MLLLYYSIIGLCTYGYGVTISVCRGVLLYTVWLCLLLCAIDVQQDAEIQYYTILENLLDIVTVLVLSVGVGNILALAGRTPPLTEMSTRNLPGGKGRPVRKADNLTAFCEPIV
jgi:hypothetical protein